jgi:hypothetical protein
MNNYHQSLWKTWTWGNSYDMFKVIIPNMFSHGGRIPKQLVGNYSQMKEEKWILKGHKVALNLIHG